MPHQTGPQIKRVEGKRVTGSEGRPPPDAYALAYLCGGTSGLLTLYLFELVQQGYLDTVEIKKWYKWIDVERRIGAVRYLPPTTELSDISKELLEWFSETQGPTETYQRVFPKKLKLQCFSYRDALFNRQLLTGWLSPEKGSELFIWTIGISMASLSAFAFLFGLISDPNIIFVFIFWFIMSSFLYFVIDSFIKIRLSPKGKRYVWRLKNKFDHLREKSISASLGDLNPDHRLAVAIFGVSALAQKNSFYMFLEPLKLNGHEGYGTEKGGAAEASEG